MSEQAQRNLIAALYLLLIWSRRIVIPVIIFYVVFWMEHSYWFLLLLLFGQGGNSAKMAHRLMSSDPWPVKVKKQKNGGHQSATGSGAPGNPPNQGTGGRQ